MPVGQILRWLGGKIDIKVEVASLLVGATDGVWDSSLWGAGTWAIPDADFQDISSYVMGIKIARGQDRWEERFRTGSCTLTLNNDSGIFTPDSGNEPWSTPFRPGRLFRVMCNPDPDAPDTWVALFTGRMDSSTDGIGDAGASIIASVVLHDALAELAQNNPPATTATGVQLTSERVTAALNYAGWDAGDRDIQTGEHNIKSSELAQSTLEECQRAAEAEGGVFYADAENILVFKARDWLTTDTRSTTYQGYLGYTGSAPGSPAAEIVDVRRSFELARVRNDVQFSRDGGSMQQADDSASQALYGVRSHKRTDLDNTNDTDVLFLAERYLAAYKDSRPRIEGATIVANDDPGNDDLNPLFYDLQFGDLLSIRVQTLHGWSVTKDVHVIGIEDNITPNDWERTLTLDDSIIEAIGESSSSSS